MPTLDWIGKATVVKHHKDVPYRLLEPVPRIHEIWFPGVHSDTGGGYQHHNLSDYTLILYGQPG